MVKNFLAFAALAALVPINAAQGQPLIQSQEGIALENQILQLQSQIQQLRSGSGSGNGSSLGNAAPVPPPSSSGPPPASSVATNLLSQVAQLQFQVQELNGEVDTLQNQVNTQHDATEKEIADLKFQMTNGATPGAMPALQASAATPTAAPPPAAPASPSAILHAGEAAYAKHDYATAEAAARKILANGNSTPEAYEAQYLLAQTLAGEGKPQDAAIAYDDAYNLNRTGAKAPQSLLGLASSLADINQSEAACDTLASLNSQFPTPPAGLKSRIDAVEQKAHCS